MSSCSPEPLFLHRATIPGFNNQRTDSEGSVSFFLLFFFLNKVSKMCKMCALFFVCSQKSPSLSQDKKKKHKGTG